MLREIVDDRVPMYAAAGPLLPGEPLSADRLTRVDVQLGDEGDRYLSAAQGVPQGAFVLREVRPGELVPSSAVGTRDQVGVQSLTLVVDAGSAEPLVEGSVVDVYVNYLRRKIDVGFEPKLLHTVRGAGYVFKVPEQ